MPRDAERRRRRCVIDARGCWQVSCTLPMGPPGYRVLFWSTAAYLEAIRGGGCWRVAKPSTAAAAAAAAPQPPTTRSGWNSHGGTTSGQNLRASRMAPSMPWGGGGGRSRTSKMGVGLVRAKAGPSKYSPGCRPRAPVTCSATATPTPARFGLLGPPHAARAPPASGPTWLLRGMGQVAA